jgi:hypothetical protein
MRDGLWSQWRNDTEARYVAISNLNQLRWARANLPCSSGSANVERLKIRYVAPPCGKGTIQPTLQHYARAAVQASDA